jgi:hypothetical protein
VHPCTVTCPAAPDPASLLGRARVLPHVTRLRTPPPCSGGLWYCHVSHSSGPRLLAREGSSVAMCHDFGPASLLRRAPVLPRAPRPRTLPPSTAPDPASLLRRAPVLPRAPRLRTLPPCSGGLQCCHTFRDSQRAAGLKNKERISWPTYAARLACFQDTLARYRGVYKTCGQTALS